MIKDVFKVYIQKEGILMKMYHKSHKLDYVCYDIRGPVMDEAGRMEAEGVDILKLNIGVILKIKIDTDVPIIDATTSDIILTKLSFLLNSISLPYFII